MAETLDDLTAQLEALNKMRASGVSVISYVANGTQRSITRKSDIEMQGAQRDLERRIAALSGTPSRIVRINSSKGFCSNDRD
jgi:hypothetical protein